MKWVWGGSLRAWPDSGFRASAFFWVVPAVEPGPIRRSRFDRARRMGPCFRRDDPAWYRPLRARLGPQIAAQRLLPVRDGGDQLLPQQDVGLLAQIGLEAGRRARIDLDQRQRPGQRVARHRVALGGIETVDRIRHLGGVVLEVVRDVLPGLEVG